MAGKDIHSDVEGHGMRFGKRSDGAEPETTDTQRSTDEPEVEGHALRGRGAPVAEVEGHGVRVKRSDDGEPKTTDTQRSSDEPEVEGQLMKGRGGPVDEGQAIRAK